AVTDTPNAARRINVSAGIRRINRCSAARTRSVSHTPRISHLPHRTGGPTGAHARKFGRSSETFVVVLLFPYASQAETAVGEPLPRGSVRGASRRSRARRASRGGVHTTAGIEPTRRRLRARLDAAAGQVPGPAAAPGELGHCRRSPGNAPGAATVAPAVRCGPAEHRR